ncbi:MAG: tRNA uridine-5-carboxymethylaminomethyl(34) synthesis enzyme MnmG, partial [Mycoplasmataceae bacterium]|jgi:tRNA uridine 5-carboxymethylaminomethyl modification enzyme|nr:tRNA uridine-5-carboxymethylaminomethyl(34) synthesis enzyme MnmG [Mycoplasmataceae bacterium]
VINAKAVIITAGTYMKAKTFSGFNFENAGPVFDYQNNKHQIKTEVSPRSNYLSDSLKKNGIETIRLKTGTPPRIYKKTIDFKNLEIQKGSCEKLAFEHFNQTYLSPKNQLNCHMVYTNTKTHRIILDNLKKSPMYRGKIKSIGPRYCPSIEDKVVRFSDKPRHQLFIEPESTLMDTVYLQGFSTALPKKIQDKMIRTLQGFKKCKVQRYAYAIEYDAINPMQLFPTLETKKIRRLFFAGQINGTSGYEEAAGQGIVAGINTALKIKNAKPLILKRSESYIGVMIDDIVTKGVSDPYRLLTSRAEYRLFLRNDNADDRLIKYGFKYGLIPKGNYQFYLKQNKNINELIRLLKNTSLGSKLVNKYGNSNHNLYDLLKRPEIKLTDILQNNITNKLTIESIYKLEILVKFEGYLISQQKNIDKFNKMENICLAKIKDYRLIKNLSLEARDKLNKIKPLNLNQAQRISGLTSNDIINIKYYLDKNK